MKTLKLSIITPSFNQGDYIEQTIRSILFDQDYDNVEYIIMDGGSTDQTVDIIKKYEKKIAYWQSAPDGGQTEAINEGFKKCTGDIVTWLCSDDYYEPGIFNKVVEAFKRNDNVNLVVGNRRLFGDGIDDKTHIGWWAADSLEQTLVYGEWNQPGSFFRRNVWEKTLPLNESLNVLMDHELWLKYLFEYGVDKVLFYDEMFAYGRYHNNSKSIKDFEECFKAVNAFNYSILQNLTKGEKALTVLKDLPKIHYNNTWKINKDFDQLLYIENLLSRYRKYVDDEQCFDREFCHFYIYIQKYYDALFKSIDIIIKKPFSQRNYHLFSVVLKTYIKTLIGA